jgi:hypothetical protein
VTKPHRGGVAQGMRSEVLVGQRGQFRMAVCWYVVRRAWTASRESGVPFLVVNNGSSSRPCWGCSASHSRSAAAVGASTGVQRSFRAWTQSDGVGELHEAAFGGRAVQTSAIHGDQQARRGWAQRLRDELRERRWLAQWLPPGEPDGPAMVMM